MDIQSLEKTIGTLNASINNWRGWLDFWTGLIVVGLIIEYGKEVAEIVCHRPFSFKKLNVLIGAILVTGGVAGELFVQWLSAGDENRLRAANEQLIQILQTTAAEATNSAALASEQAAKLGVSQKSLHNYVAAQVHKNDKAMVELKHTTVRLNKARDEALAAAVSSEKVLASITEELRAERDVRQRFANMVEDRDITPTQSKGLIAGLHIFAGQQYTLTTFWDSNEPLAFTNKIYALLTSAGWKFDEAGSKNTVLFGGVSGVQVIVHPNSWRARAAATALVQALQSLGFAANIKYMDVSNEASEKLHIHIGTRT